MPDGNAHQSSSPPGITQQALARRVFNKAVNDKLKQTTLLRVLPQYLKPGIAVDVGAATGHISFFLKDYYDEIYAFEAVYPVYLQLCRMKFLRPIHAAVSNYNGKGTIYIDHKRLSNSGFQDLVGGPTDEVTVVKLDTFLEGTDRVGFLKIDVEGTEFDVLRGAEKTIDRDQPTLMVEIYKPFSAHPLDTIFDWLMSKGYHCGFYSHPDLVEVDDVAAGVDAVETRHDEHDGDFLFWKD